MKVTFLGNGDMLAAWTDRLHNIGAAPVPPDF
jgi:hypothetical protein